MDFVINASNVTQVPLEDRIDSSGNYTLQNMQVLTISENCSKDNRGQTQHMSKLNAANVRQIRKLHSTGRYTYQAIATLFNVSPSNIGLIVRRKTWRYLN